LGIHKSVVHAQEMSCAYTRESFVFCLSTSDEKSHIQELAEKSGI